MAVELATGLGGAAGMEVLDVGAGIGGPARVVAAEFGAQVTALDLPPALCETNRVLTALVGLADRVTVVEGDSTDLPLDAAAFARVVSLHDSKTIAPAPSLSRTVFRVLRTGGRFAFHDPVGRRSGAPYTPTPSH